LFFIFRFNVIFVLGVVLVDLFRSLIERVEIEMLLLDW
jgi:hypothetical protein